MERFMSYDFNITDVALAIYVNPGAGAPSHKNRSSHGISLNLGDTKKYTFQDGTVLTIKQNELIYMPMHSTYTISAKTSGCCYAINFYISEQVDFRPFVFKLKNTSEFTKLFYQANHLWKNKKQGFHMQCKSILYEILASMQQEFQHKYTAKIKFEMIKPAVKYLHENYTNELMNMGDLADLCQISEDYFRKLFKQAYGISPIKYINHLKLTYAAELINSGMYSVTEAAMESGYDNISHFSREFKRYYGVAPRDYFKNINRLKQ